MKIYLGGVEYKTYRSILEDTGVRYGCLNYEYIWSRTPHLNIEDTSSFLEELLVIPGRLPYMYMQDYVDFLNKNAKSITFALELVSPKREMLKKKCSVRVLPAWSEGSGEYFLSYSDSIRPFAKAKYKKLSEEGDSIHGLEIPMWDFLDSMSTGMWMRGRSGIMTEFVNNKLQIYATNSAAYAVSIARKLIKQGYDINLLKIKKGDWKEVSKVNCISWAQYQDYKEFR